MDKVSQKQENHTKQVLKSAQEEMDQQVLWTFSNEKT